MFMHNHLYGTESNDCVRVVGIGNLNQYLQI